MEESILDRFSRTGCIFHVWNGEALGFTVGFECEKYNERQKVVIRAVEWRHSHLRVGDVLVAIGDSPVPSELSHSTEIYSLIYELKPPVILLFHSSSNNVVYQQQAVLMNQLRLGIVLSDHLYNDRCIPIVTCVHDIQQYGHNAVHLGDVLVKVCGVHAVSMTLESIKQTVDESSRPIVLCFARVRRTIFSSISQFKSRRSLYASNRHSLVDVRSRSISYCDQESYRTNLDRVEYTSIIDEKEFPENSDGNGDVIICWEYGKLGISLKANMTGDFPIVHRLTGKGSARGIDQLQYGDELFAINEKSVAGISVRILWRELLDMAKPVVLRFKKKEGNIPAGWEEKMYDQKRRHCALIHSDDWCSQGGISSSSLDDTTTDSGISSALMATECDNFEDQSVCEDVAKVVVHRVKVTKHFVSYELTWNDGPLGLRLRNFDHPPQSRVILVEKILQHGITAQLGCVKVGDKLTSINGIRMEQNALIIKKLGTISKMPKPVTLGFVREV